MMYRIETHLHTTYISRCGWLGAEALLKSYSAAGYSAVCVTDHYNRICFEYAEIDLALPGSKIHDFLLGWRQLSQMSSEYGIKIYRGAELRFDGSDNDYLLYGFSDELIADPESVISGGLEAFSEQVRRDGALLVQAHPFRAGCTPAPAEYIDGIEVLNRNPRHENHNHLAYEYAKRNGLIMTAGSDCHRPEDVALSGIACDSLPEDSKEFSLLLRSGKYMLLDPDSPDGIAPAN